MSDTRHLAIRALCQRMLWVQSLWTAKDSLKKQMEKAFTDGHWSPKKTHIAQEIHQTKNNWSLGELFSTFLYPPLAQLESAAADVDWATWTVTDSVWAFLFSLWVIVYLLIMCGLFIFSTTFFKLNFCRFKKKSKFQGINLDVKLYWKHVMICRTRVQKCKICGFFNEFMNA